MQDIINKYLSNRYYVDKDSLRENNIYFKGTPMLVYWSDLLSEISYSFSYSDELSDIFIKNWLILMFPNYSLNSYYLKVKPVFNLFPLARRVFSKTIGNDLIAVQPMNQPKCNLFYLDTVYGETKWVKFKRKITRFYKKILSGYRFKNKKR